MYYVRHFLIIRDLVFFHVFYSFFLPTPFFCHGRRRDHLPVLSLHFFFSSLLLLLSS
jgi:hypothetical protein